MEADHQNRPPGIRLVIADDHALYRDMLAEFLQRSGFIISGVSANTPAFTQLFRPGHLPDIAILNYKTSRPDSLVNARWLKKNYPMVKILLNTLYNYKIPFPEFKSIGVEGVVIKASADPRQIVKALHSLYAGQTFYPARPHFS